MTVKIEKNIPLPNSNTISNIDAESIIDEMQIGDSILVNNPANLTKIYLTAQKMRLANGYEIVKDNPKWKGGTYYATDYPKVISRTVKKDEQTYEVRLWRVK